LRREQGQHLRRASLIEVIGIVEVRGIAQRIPQIDDLRDASAAQELIDPRDIGARHLSAVL